MNHLDHISRDVLELILSIQDKRRGLITLAEYTESRQNSYERELLLPFLNEQAFRSRVENALKNVAPMRYPGKPAGTYDEACIHTLLPDAMRRITALQNKLHDLEYALLRQASR